MGVTSVGLICSAALAGKLAAELRRLRFDLRAIWTPDLTVTISVASEFEIGFASANASDEVLLRKEVELVIICGVPQLHSRVSVKALGIGKHVVCGTAGPSMGLTLGDANKMLSAALYYPQLISVAGLNMRQLPVFKKLKALVDDGLVGNVDLLELKVICSSLNGDGYDWLCESRMGGGVLNVLGAEFIDVIQFVLNRKVQRVMATMKNHSGANRALINGIYSTVHADDFCQVNLSLEGDCLATVNVNCNYPLPMFTHELSLFGQTGCINVKNNQVDLIRKDGSIQSQDVGLSSEESQRATASDVLFMGFQQLLQSLCDVSMETLVKRDKSWQTGPLADAPSFQDGKQIQEVLQAALKSAESERWVTVDTNNTEF